MKESVIQKGILDLLAWKAKTEQFYWFRAGAGAMKTSTGRFFKTGRPGLPDIVILYHGRFIGAEVKNEKGRMSASQKQAKEEIINAGGEYHVVRSVADVKLIFGW